MDATVSRIVDYTSGFRFETLPVTVVHECKRRVIDTLGCAIGAYDAEPSRIARAVALRADAAGGARVLGTARRTLPELAAFANGVMGRYLDGNDTYPGGGGHPSDMIAATLAVSDAVGGDGKAMIAATALAYEVYHNVFQPTRLREKGMDNVFYTAVGSAAAVAKLLALDREQTANAVSLAITPNISLEATRRGKLSMWKGSAAGNAARNGVFAAVLAANGMTGPEKPVEDEKGLFGLVGRFALAPFGGDGQPYRVTQSNLKYFLSEYHSQSPITVALQLQPQVSVNEIASITIYTDRFTWYEIGSEPEKWHPTTRETADHSLPYIIAAVLIDGHFSDRIFDAERLGDPRIHDLADKIAVKEHADYSRRFPQAIPCRMEIVTRSGARTIGEIEYPRGHVNNPMTDDEINAKFCGLAERALPQARVESALGLLWKLDELNGLGAVFEAMQVTKR